MPEADFQLCLAQGTKRAISYRAFILCSFHNIINKCYKTLEGRQQMAWAAITVLLSNEVYKKDHEQHFLLQNANIEKSVHKFKYSHNY